MPSDGLFDGDLFDNGWLDETQLDYCPACGSELVAGEGPLAVECPEHGEVSIDFTDEPLSGEELFESMFGDELDIEQGREEDISEFDSLADLMDLDEDDDGDPDPSVRGRINSILGRDG